MTYTIIETKIQNGTKKYWVRVFEKLSYSDQIHSEQSLKELNNLIFNTGLREV